MAAQLRPVQSSVQHATSSAHATPQSPPPQPQPPPMQQQQQQQQLQLTPSHSSGAAHTAAAAASAHNPAVFLLSDEIIRADAKPLLDRVAALPAKWDREHDSSRGSSRSSSKGGSSARKNSAKRNRAHSVSATLLRSSSSSGHSKSLGQARAGSEKAASSRAASARPLYGPCTNCGLRRHDWDHCARNLAYDRHQPLALKFRYSGGHPKATVEDCEKVGIEPHPDAPHDADVEKDGTLKVKQQSHAAAAAASASAPPLDRNHTADGESSSSPDLPIREATPRLPVAVCPHANPCMRPLPLLLPQFLDSDLQRTHDTQQQVQQSPSPTPLCTPPVTAAKIEEGIAQCAAASSRKAPAASSSAPSSASSSSAAAAASSAFAPLTPTSIVQQADQAPQRVWHPLMAAPPVRDTLRAFTGSWFSLAELLGEPRVADRNGVTVPSSSSASAGAVTHGLIAHHASKEFALFNASPAVSALSEAGKIEVWNATIIGALNELNRFPRARFALHSEATLCVQSACSKSVSEHATSGAAAARPPLLSIDFPFTHWRVVPYAGGRCRCGVLSHPNASEQSPELADLCNSLFTVLSGGAQPRTFYSLLQVSELFHNELAPVQLSSEHNRLQLRSFDWSANAALSSSLDAFYCDSSNSMLRCVEALLMHDVETQTLLHGFGVRLTFRWIEPAAQGVSAAAVLDSAGLQVAWILVNAERARPSAATALDRSASGLQSALQSSRPLDPSRCKPEKQSFAARQLSHAVAGAPAPSSVAAASGRSAAPLVSGTGSTNEEGESSAKDHPTRAVSPSLSDEDLDAELSESHQTNSSDESFHDDDAEMADAAEDDSGAAAASKAGAGSAAASRRHSRPALEQPKCRTLPDFFIEPRTGEQMDRPIRKSETHSEFRQKYKKWVRRGTRVWTPKELTEARERRRERQPIQAAAAAASSSSDTRKLTRQAAKQLVRSADVPDESSDDSSSSDDESDDEAADGEAAAAAASPSAASSAVEYSDFTLPDLKTGEMLRRPIQRAMDHPAYIVSYKAYGHWTRRTGYKLKQHKQPSQASSSVSSDDEAAVFSPNQRKQRVQFVPRLAARSLPDFYVNPSTGERVYRPTRQPGESKLEGDRLYHLWKYEGKKVWTPAELKQARERTRQPQQVTPALSKASTRQPSEQGAHSTLAHAASHGAHDSGAAPANDSALLRHPNGRLLELVSARSLPDFYIDRASGKRVKRPTRKVTETDRAFAARYDKWRVRGRAVWTPADIEQVQQRRSQSLKQAQQRQNEPPAAASSSSAAAGGARARASPPKAAAAASDSMNDDEGDDSVAVDKRSSSAGEGHSDSDFEPIPPRPTLIDCGDNPAKFETRLAEWLQLYGDRSDVEQEEEPLLRAQRRARYIGSSGQHVHKPSRLKGQLESEACGSDDDDDSDYADSEDSQVASSSAAAAPSRSHKQTTRRRSPAASSAAVAAPSSLSVPNLHPLSLSSSSNEMKSFLSQLMASFSGNQAATGEAQSAVASFVGQLRAPASAAAIATSASSRPPLDAMRDVGECEGAGGSSMPPLVDSHSSAAQSSHLQSGRGAGSPFLAAPPSAAASAAVKGKRKADFHSDHSAAELHDAAGGAAAAAAAPSSDPSGAHLSKKSRPSAIPILPPIAFSSHPQAAAASSPAHASSATADRLAATSSLELILAECIPDATKRAACLTAFADGDITLEELERDVSSANPIYFPRVGVPPLVQWGLIPAGPAAKLQSIIRERIELKQQADEDCVEIKREARAAGNHE